MKISFFTKCKELLGSSKKIVIICICLTLFQVILSVANTIFGAYYGIDVALMSKDMSKLMFFIFVTFIYILIDIIVFHIVYKLGIIEFRKIALNLRQRVFNKAIYLDKEYHNTHASGGILNTIDYDIDLYTNMMVSTISNLFGIITKMGIFFAIISIINFKLSLILWIATPLFALIAVFSNKAQSKIHEKRRSVNKQRIAFINEGIMGVKTIKSLNLEEKEVEEFKGLNRKYFRYRMAELSQRQLFWRSFDIAFHGSLVVLFLMSYKLNISYGELYLYYSIFRNCLFAVSDLTGVIDYLSEEKVSMNKIYDLLMVEPIVKDKEITLDKNDNLIGNIEFKNINFKYPKGEKVLSDFNLVIPNKSKVAIVGKTGSGKSTIASLLFRFYEPSEGKILIDNIDYTNLKLEYLHKQIGFILQDPLLFDDTITNNVKYGKLDASDEEVVKACKLVGADEFITKLKNGYKTNIGEGGIILSLGQKQLLAFARVILSNPSIIILDEATSNIDSETETLIQKNINTLFKDKTCLFIAHRLSTIKNVDKIIYLDKGQIIESGSHDELMRLQGRYATLYNNQFMEKSLKEILE